MAQTTSRPIPQAPDADGNYTGYHVSFWRKPWVQQVLPWVTSLGVHAALIGLALILLLSGALNVLIPQRVQQQVGVPTATLATDNNIGAIPNVGNLDDVTSENKSLNPVAESNDYRNVGEGNAASDLLTPTSGGAQTSNISGITGMGSLSDALGGGGGEGSPLFGEAGGGSGFMGIDIGRPGTGSAVHRIVFVCDSSGSMDHEKKFLLMDELKKAVEPLVVDQLFNVIFFSNNDYYAAFPGELKPATRRFKDDMREFLDGVTMTGMTNPVPALETAFAMEPELIFFLTDGDFNGMVGYEEVLASVERLNADGDVMINTIQFITREPQAEEVLRLIAENNGGTYRFVSRDDL